jgi:hypothetical protein
LCCDTLFHQTRWLTEGNKASGNRAGVLETMGTPARYQDAGGGSYGMAPTIYFKQELLCSAKLRSSASPSKIKKLGLPRNISWSVGLLASSYLLGELAFQAVNFRIAVTRPMCIANFPESRSCQTSPKR